jgi:hypothetical protein
MRIRAVTPQPSRDARNRESTKNTLISQVEHAMAYRLTGAASRCSGG